MTVEWHTKKINMQLYYKVIRRGVILNADNGTPNSGYEFWKWFKKNIRTVIMPVERMDEFKHMFKHLEVDTNGKMAWGFTGKGEWYWFVTDSRNPMIFMQNVGPAFHEILHVIYLYTIGSGTRIRRRYDAPDGREGTLGPASTVIVHDNWYGSKESIRVWFLHSTFIPTRMPYIPVWKAIEMYKV